MEIPKNYERDSLAYALTMLMS
ncbi:hypothetical protein B4U80_07662 [Leptotrombidium deliense]|uniref:Uncharacterized protein n=1 Tax=Leptotrombidium deliense TaxID=299467 RepID=A0A443Q814_9ACAR|nr:hypothetical protein B4U80_07662 [Leptotrombidium deliense]